MSRIEWVFTQVKDFWYEKIQDLFQWRSNELSSPAQQLFLTYYEERSYFKGYGHVLIKTERRTPGHISKFDLVSIWKSSCRLGRLFYTAPTINREKSGIDLILRKHPTYFATDFDLLFLVDLIHVFRILELFCKVIKRRLEDEPRVRFWVLHAIVL